MHPLSARRIIFLSSLGGAFEMYDFVVYIYLAPYLSELFFPKESSFAATLSVFAVFAIGYIVRPLGGVVFGHFGDILGRKKMFVLSILLMSIPILLMGLLPTYSMLGLSATLIFIGLRILQGFAVGGEIPGAMTFTCEYVAPQHRGFASAAIYTGLNYGITFAALIVAFLSAYFTHEQMQAFGWRVPFILGGLLGIIAVYLRTKAQESPLFLQLQQNAMLDNAPLKTLLRQRPLDVLRGILLVATGSAVLVIGFAYTKSYLTVELHYPVTFSGWLLTAVTFLSATLQLLFGWLSDKYGRKKWLMAGYVLMFILSYPIFYGMTLGTLPALVAMTVLLAVVAAMVISIYPCVLIELFPTPERYSGYAFSYNIAFALFGGLSPLVVTYLIHRSGNLAMPGLYLAGISILSIIGLWGIRDRYRQTLH